MYLGVSDDTTKATVSSTGLVTADTTNTGDVVITATSTLDTSVSITKTLRVQSAWRLVTETAEWLVRHSHQAVVFDNKMWVMGGYDNFKNDVWSSSDGANWTSTNALAGWSARAGH